MIRVAVTGAAGRMGSLVCATVDAAIDLDLVAAIDVNTDRTEILGIPVVDDPAAAFDADVVVDFTTPDSVLANLTGWSGSPLHAVVGTSGFDADRIAGLEASWQGPGRCLVVPNFSVGAVLMMRMAELAASHLKSAEIIELHHDQKVDAPSGTSIATAARMAAVRGESRETVPIHSVRLPGLVAHQVVVFGGVGETLTIRHDSLDRGSFMPGVVAAIRGVADLPSPVTVGLDSILGL